MLRFIFITGGVVSSIGKGLTSASIAALLQARGYKVCLRKLDPYLNVDPGTMNPSQHGEVFVTNDGAEADLDLGHYERFTNNNCTKNDNTTAGKIYLTLLERERRGDYLGQTVQVIPHVTNLIKEFIYAHTDGFDFVLCEIGGTVGDIEALPFFECIRQVGNELGRNRVQYVHLTLLPYLTSSSELKTKPTQHSVKELRAIGIQPDVLICRSARSVRDDVREKIALFCNIPASHIVAAYDVKSIYAVPLRYAEEELDIKLLNGFGISAPPALQLDQWIKINEFEGGPKVKVGLVGKYSSEQDCYISIKEALKHSALFLKADVEVVWISAKSLKDDLMMAKLAEVDALIVPGGFGIAGTEEKIQAIKYARTHNVPFLGICLGMQLAVVEFARSECSLTDAGSTEFGRNCTPVVSLLGEEQENLGGTMRLGEYACHISAGSLAHRVYGADVVGERHRHRYEVNERYVATLEAHGMTISGRSDQGLVEIVELKGHPWFLACQFHPEFKSRIFAPHPLFVALVRAGLERATSGTRSSAG